LDNKRKDDSFPVRTLFEENKKELRLRLVSGENGLNKLITEKEIHRPGLALSGFTDLFTFQRVQICGNTEVAYLRKLKKDQRVERLKKFFSFDIPCIIITNGNRPTPEFVMFSNEKRVPTLRTPFETTTAFRVIGDYLAEKFAPRTILHGSLVDVYGIGILITGRSGIGKSEVALDLIARGHRLVADDVITVIKKTDDIVIGKGNETLEYNMEIRGVGIIDIKSVFGIRGVRRQKRIEVEVELVDWDNSEKYERLGMDNITASILGVETPLVRLPIYPGKNISVIVEVIALNQLLKIYGQNSARDFETKLKKIMDKKLKALDKYLGHDFE